MSEMATEALERNEHLQHNPDDHHAKRAALIIGVLAAILAVCDMMERSSQNAYLSHHIAASNEYAFYQARQTRALVLNQTSALMAALPPTPETQKAAADATAESKRLTEDSERGNGAKQIQARAAAESDARDKALHRYEWFEIVTSGLQIAIVLASVSVVTQLVPVLLLSLAVGGVAAVLGGLVAAGVV